MKLIWMALGLVSGGLMSVQAGVNTTLRGYLGDAVLAALTNFVVGSLALLAVTLVAGNPICSAVSSGSQAPWWAWLGGCMGAVFVTLSVVLAPMLGATTMFTLIICGQLLASVAMDHFGVLGFRQDPMSLRKVLGVALLAVGAWLVVARR